MQVSKVAKDLNLHLARSRINTISPRLPGLSQIYLKKISQMKEDTAQIMKKLEELESGSEATEVLQLKKDLSFAVSTLNTLKEYKKNLEKAPEKEFEVPSFSFPDTNELQEARKEGENLHTKTIVYAHERDLITLGNNIMGEFLKGFCETCQYLSTSKTRGKLDHINSQLKDMFNKSSFDPDSSIMLLMIPKDTNLLLQNLENMKNSVHETSKKYRANTQELIDKVKDLKEEIGKLRDKCEYYEKKEVFIQSQMDVANNILAKIYLEKGMIEGEDTCSKCFKVYTDPNESKCICHPSPWNGEIYFCCGQRDKKATGCSVLKHTNLEFERIKDKLLKFRKIVCSNCHSKTHTCHQCPKDPNSKNNRDQDSELRRMATARIRIKKANFYADMYDKYNDEDNFFR